MSFTDRLLLWLHVAFALLSIGPLTVATMATPRYVRARNLPVLRFLARTTRIYSVVGLGVLILGIVLAQLRNDFGHPWVSISMTLFVVAIALLVLVMRDQHRAIVALDAAARAEMTAAQSAVPVASGTGPAAELPGGEQDSDPDAAQAPPAAELGHLASVERGRIASMAGLVSLIWLVILALMIWQP